MGANLHDAALTAMTLHATWFTIQHSDVCNKYTKGVLPGDPEADILFMMVIKEALDEIQKKIREAGLNIPDVLMNPRTQQEFSVSVPDHTVLPSDVSYSDDGAIVVTGSAEEINDITAK
eukprot:581089-Lingulodinium_polyedra.AAC.1